MPDIGRGKKTEINFPFERRVIVEQGKNFFWNHLIMELKTVKEREEFLKGKGWLFNYTQCRWEWYYTGCPCFGEPEAWIGQEFIHSVG